MSDVLCPAGGDSAESAIDDQLNRAEAMLRADPDETADLLAWASASLSGHRDLVRTARIARMRALLSLQEGNYSAAMSDFRKARRNWLAVGDVGQFYLAELGCLEVRLAQGEYAFVLDSLERLQEAWGQETGIEEALVTRVSALFALNLGEARAGVGETGAALHLFDVAEELFRAVNDLIGVARVQVARGTTALELGMAHRALAELTSGHSRYRDEGWAREAGVTVTLLARAQAMTGQVVVALDSLDQAATAMRGCRLGLGMVKVCRAQILVSIGSASAALSAALAAEEIFSDLDVTELLARATLIGAEAQLLLDLPEKAGEDFSTADRLFASCGAELLRPRAWLGLAEAALFAGDTEQAARFCAQITGGGRVEVSDQLLVQAWVLASRCVGEREGRRHLETAAEIALQSGLPGLRMTVCLERARRAMAVGAIDEAMAELRQSQDVGRAWQQKRHRIAPVLDGPVAKLMTDTNDLLIDALMTRGNHAGRTEAWQLARSQKMTALVSAAADVGSTEPADVLPAVPQSPLLEYYVNGDDVIVFIARDGLMNARRLTGIREETRDLVTAWNQECLLLAAMPGPAAGDAWSPSLDSVYDLLVAPVRDLLSDLEEPIRVVPHRHLGALPIQAMLAVGGPWWTLLGPLSPRGRVLSQPAARSAGADEIRALVLAVPDDSAPSISNEARQIARHLPSARVLDGDDATRENLLRYASDAHVVHLACHGNFRRDAPLQSSLELGDGRLTAEEILHSDYGFRDSVVVLSACGSGLAADLIPEPLGLAWACLAVGARAVIASLWSVDDAVTAELMSGFYAKIAAGYDAETALSEAQRSVAAEHPHPYYWAAFCCISRAHA